MWWRIIILKLTNITNTILFKINFKRHFNYVTPKINGIESTTFYDNAIQDWNLLPDSTKSITDLQMIKKEILCHLKYIYTSEEL